MLMLRLITDYVKIVAFVESINNSNLHGMGQERNKKFNGCG